MNNKKLYLVFKRIFDVVFALVLLVFASPIMILTAIVIKLESKGPIFFIHERPGKNGKLFKVTKLRTMMTETEKNGKQIKNVDRITKLGALMRKASIDELPQLLNILKGEMSFIGPRPLLVEYLQYYNPEQMRRHEVTPGISGWAQVNGRNTITWEDKFKYDVFYVDNISLSLDFKIFFLTIYKIIKQSDIVITEKFKGTIYE